VLGLRGYYCELRLTHMKSPFVRAAQSTSRLSNLARLSRGRAMQVTPRLVAVAC
jgi:hypothetical protein